MYILNSDALRVPFLLILSTLILSSSSFLPNKAICKTAQGKSSQDSIIINNYARKIEQVNLRNHIELLASESFQGREVGQRGQKMAGIYIQDFFIKNDLEPIVPTPFGNRYFQKFKIQKSKVVGASIEHKGEKKTTKFSHKEDFLINPTTYLQSQEGLPVVLMSGQIEVDEQQLEGRAVALFLETQDKQKVFFASQSMEEQEIRAKKAGVKAIFWILSDEKHFQYNKNYLSRSRYLNKHDIYTLKDSTGVGVYFLSTEMAAKLFDYSTEKIESLASESKIVTAGVPLAFSRLDIDLKKENQEEVETENVLAFVEGSDLKDEVIVVSAHYDHIGKHDGKTFAGADDNASGVAALLELARTFAIAKEDGFIPRRSILFLALSAEEVGMLGSTYYTDFDNIKPIENTVTNLNIDMIGREFGKNKYPENDYVCLVGADWLSPLLHQTSQRANKESVNIHLDYTYNDKNHRERFFYRSDQYNFAKHSIPVIFYTSPDHEDYHKHTDTVEKIDFNRVEKVSRLIFYTTWLLANQEVSPKDNIKSNTK